MVTYNFCTASADELWKILQNLNDYQDKIVGVTQNGNLYTIFYEDRGNAKEGTDD